MRCVKTIIAFAFIALHFSCLGIENTFTLNENGGGRLAFQYRVSQMFRSLDKTDGEAETKSAPLPVTEEELRKTLSKLEGVSLLSVRQWEDESDIFVKGELEFKSVAALNKSELFADMPVSLTREGSRTTFSLLLTEKREPLDAETLASYQALFTGYQISFRLVAPRPITEHNRGTLSADGRTLTFEIGLADFMKLSEKTEWRASW